MNDVVYGALRATNHNSATAVERQAEHVLSVVVNYNAGPMLQRCVESWLTAGSHGDLVIVDNASTDNSLDFLHKDLYCKSEIHVVRNTQNLGFSVAVNQGLQFKTFDYVFILNPDCICGQDAIDTMLDVLRAEPEIGMVGPALMNPDGSEQAGGRRAVPTPWRSLVRACGLSRLSHRYPRLFSDFLLHRQPFPHAPVDVEAISGACILAKQAAIKEVGLLDEGYFMHCEDLDWCMRFRKADWRILFVPDARVIHYQGTCSRSNPIFVEWHKHKGMLRFYRKFFRHQYPGVLMWLVTIGVALRFVAAASYFTARLILDWLRGALK